MTNNVVHLPDSMQRQWRIYEAELRNAMVSAEVSEDAITHACEQIKPVYLRYAQPAKFNVDHGDPEKAVHELNDWVFAQIFGLLQVLAVREVELFQLRGGDH